MRRALPVVLAGALLLPVAACTTNAKSTDAKGEGAPAATVSVPNSLPPLPDYSVNTRLVCDRLQSVYSGELRDFGTAIGKMVSYQEAKQAPDAQKAQKEAAGKLKAAGAKIRQDTAGAEDPALQAAGAASAEKFERSAQDGRYLARVKTMKDLDGTLRAQMAEWLTPVSGYC